MKCGRETVAEFQSAREKATPKYYIRSMSFPVTALTKTAAVRRATRTDAKRLVAAVLTAAGRSKRAGFKPHNKLLHTKAQ